jgi:hypothetical protein
MRRAQEVRAEFDANQSPLVCPAAGASFSDRCTHRQIDIEKRLFRSGTHALTYWVHFSFIAMLETRLGNYVNDLATQKQLLQVQEGNYCEPMGLLLFQHDPYACLMP